MWAVKPSCIGRPASRDARIVSAFTGARRNTSSPSASESALITALRDRKIAGAGLDVYDIEPLPPDHPFRWIENVITTPHIGYVTKRTYQTFYGHTVENILAWIEGQPIRVMES